VEREEVLRVMWTLRIRRRLEGEVVVVVDILGGCWDDCFLFKCSGGLWCWREFERSERSLEYIHKVHSRYVGGMLPAGSSLQMTLLLGFMSRCMMVAERLEDSEDVL
jgi:hypothetical protein